MKSTTSRRSAPLSVVVSAAVVAGAVATALAAAPKKDADQYVVEIKSTAVCAVGKECKVDVTLKAKGEFHINDKYPTKFKANDPAPAGVTFVKPVVKAEDGRIAEKEGFLPVTFKVSKAGRVRIGGVLSFSVASDANVLMEKVDLEVDVEVK